MKSRLTFIFFTIFFYPILLHAQEANNTGQPDIEKSTAAFKPTHSVGLVIGHAHVFEGRDAEGNKKVLALPLWGVDYNFKFAPKWAFGLHTDIIVETFTVEKNLESGGESEVVEREKPIAPALMGFFNPNHHWIFGLGMGAEFAPEEDYILTRASVEYEAEIRKGWGYLEVSNTISGGRLMIPGQ